MRASRNLSMAFSAAAFALLGLALGNFWLTLADRSDREIRLASEIGSLWRTDEALTMSALLAAASDDTYERRYRRLLREREGIIARMRSLAPSAELLAMIDAVNKAQLSMIAVELESFRLNALGERDAAYALLHELEYRRGVGHYDRAMTRISDKLREHSALSTETARRWLFVAVGLILALAIATIVNQFRLRALRAREQVREASRRAHRTIMQTVMDAHNNFLNNIIYFRVKAETSSDFDREALDLIDQAIEEARDKLQVIADLDVDKALSADGRDLGADIEVLRDAAEAAAAKTRERRAAEAAARREAEAQAPTTTDDAGEAAADHDVTQVEAANEKSRKFGDAA